MNTFDDDNELGFFEQPPRRPPRDRQRRPQRGGPRRQGPPAASNGVLHLAGLVALGIAIVFGFALWISSCSGQPKQSYSSYLTAMQKLAQDSASVGKDFATALTTRGLTLDGFKSQLLGWSKQEQDYYVAAERLQPPGPLQSAHAEALATFQLRANSLTGLANTLTIAEQKHDSASVVAAALASQAQLLSTSDVVWEQLYKLPVMQALKAQNVTGVKVPGSQIVTSPDIVSAHQLAIVYQRVATPSHAGNGPRIHGSALIRTTAVYKGVSTVLSKTTATTVSTSISDLAIDVVVEDSGDFPEVQIPVTVTIKAAGQTLYTQTQNLAQITPHAQETVSFTNVQVPNSALSHNATISVSITKVKGEAKLDNNSATYPVFFQLASN